jgi:hypothetical protein
MSIVRGMFIGIAVTALLQSTVWGQGSSMFQMTPIAAQTTGPRMKPGAAVDIQALAQTVDPATGLFRVTGQIVNTGSRPADSVTITATFDRVTGDESEKQLVLPALAPGAHAFFNFETYVGLAPVFRYTINVTARSAAGASIAQETQNVPPSAYAELARENIRVRVDLGAPTASARGMVQVFVSIAGTGPIPPLWVRDVDVVIPFARGSSEVHLVPGETVVILVPPFPQGPAVVLGPPAVVGEQPLALVQSIVGTPQVVRVILGAF